MILVWRFFCVLTAEMGCKETIHAPSGGGRGEETLYWCSAADKASGMQGYKNDYGKAVRLW